MAKHTRIYTRTGDDGTTGLIGGTRIKKSALRIEAYGTVDELSSAIGLARAQMSASATQGERAIRLDAWLAWTQDVLFNLGSQLAAPENGSRAAVPKVHAADVEALEHAVDVAERDLPALANFIHPSGSIPGAQLHLARAICRRAERRVVELLDREKGGADTALRFLNRLSDALFVWSRWINDALGAPENLWDPSRKPPLV
jgi:cob(I)alamin adenosyltransferase